MMPLLAVPFAIVAAWLLYEALWQAAAPLRFRVLALTGFLLVVTGVYVHQIPVIVVGLIGFAIGEGFATLYTRTRDHEGWTAPMPKRVAKRKGRRRRGAAGASYGFVSAPELVDSADPLDAEAAETTLIHGGAGLGGFAADEPMGASERYAGARAPGFGPAHGDADRPDDASTVVHPGMAGALHEPSPGGFEPLGADALGDPAREHSLPDFSAPDFSAPDFPAPDFAAQRFGPPALADLPGPEYPAADLAGTGYTGTDFPGPDFPAQAFPPPEGPAHEPVPAGTGQYTHIASLGLGVGLGDEWTDDPTNTLTGGLIDARAHGMPFDSAYNGVAESPYNGAGRDRVEQYGTGQYAQDFGPPDAVPGPYPAGPPATGSAYTGYGPDPDDPLFGTFNAGPPPAAQYPSAPYPTDQYAAAGAASDYPSGDYPSGGYPAPESSGAYADPYGPPPQGGPYAPDGFTEAPYAGAGTDYLSDPLFADPLHPAGYSQSVPMDPYAGPGSVPDPYYAAEQYGTGRYAGDQYAAGQYAGDDQYAGDPYGGQTGGYATDQYGATADGYGIPSQAEYSTGGYAPPDAAAPYGSDAGHPADAYGTGGYPLDGPGADPYADGSASAADPYGSGEFASPVTPPSRGGGGGHRRRR